MFSKALSTLAVALAATSMVSAQTSTLCNPTLKDCPADPAFGKDSVDCDWTKGACKGIKELDGTKLKYTDKGAEFSMSSEKQAPTAATSKYIFFGRIDVEVQAAKGNGIITSAVLQSDDLDEIDWEWVGNDDGHVQSNYFSKGDDGTYNRGGTHVVSSPLSTVHTYSIEWTKDAVKWIIDGNTVRTLEASKAGDKFPQTPMQVKVGCWVAGTKDGPPGRTEWAGGVAQFGNGPAVGYYKSIKITDYAGGNSATDKSVKSYSYGDRSGKSGSIKLDAGSSSGDDDKTTSKAPSSTDSAKPTKTGDKSTMDTAKPTGGSSATTGSQTDSASKPSATVPGNAAGRTSAGVAVVAGVVAAQLLL